MTAATYSPAEINQIARTIRAQITPGVLMSLGASDLGHASCLGVTGDQPGLVFVGRILPFDAKGKRMSRPRKMVIEVALTPADTYDVLVSYRRAGDPYGLKSDPIVHEHLEGIYADQLAGALLRLDTDDDRA